MSHDTHKLLLVYCHVLTCYVPSMLSMTPEHLFASPSVEEILELTPRAERYLGLSGVLFGRLGYMIYFSDPE